MTPDPTPHDHGAAGFCTDHAQPERAETVARVLWDTRCIEGDVNHRILREPTRRESLRIAAAVVAAMDDESECSVCTTADEVRADATRHAGWVEAMRFAHHAHASETSNGYPSANGVLGAGPDAVIVDGDWLAQVEADLTAARAALDRVRALADEAIDAVTVHVTPRDVDHRPCETFARARFAARVFAALDPEEPR